MSYRPHARAKDYSGGGESLDKLCSALAFDVTTNMFIGTWLLPDACYSSILVGHEWQQETLRERARARPTPPKRDELARSRDDPSSTARPSETLTEPSVAFIVGSPRSGTTWLQRLLAEHPAVYTGQESNLFDWFVGPMLRKWHRTVAMFDGHDPSRRDGIGLGAYLNTEEFRDLLRPMIHPRWRRRAWAKARLFLEKTPAHCLFLPEIVEMLPKARFIHLVRDPRDVVASLLRASESWGKMWAHRAVRRTPLRSGRGTSRPCSERRKRLGEERFFEIRYEDLHRAPAEGLSRLVGFMGLEWSRSAIDQSVEVNSAEQTRAGMATPLPVFGQLGKSVSLVQAEPSGFVGRARPGGGKDDLSLRQKRRVAGDPSVGRRVNGG